ncbi:MAG: nucleotidyltransferase family protein [Clostridia bacterium]|nr:nucleotidyltransferase family protein [Clostridia bacterium]
MKAILLAAGYATRLYPLTKDKPKSLLPLGRRLIIDYILDSIDSVKDIDEIILVTNARFASQFQAWADSLDRSDKATITVLNDGTDSDDNKRGAIGDIKFVIDSLNIHDDVVILAGDNIFTYDINDMYAFFKEKSAPTLVAINVPEKHQLQKLAVALIDDNGQILDMVEKPQEPKSNWGIYATYFYGKDILPLIDEYLAEGNSPDAPGNFPSWLYKRMPIYAYKAEGSCIDIGTVENYYSTVEKYKDA